MKVTDLITTLEILDAEFSMRSYDGKMEYRVAVEDCPCLSAFTIFSHDVEVLAEVAGELAAYVAKMRGKAVWT